MGSAKRSLRTRPSTRSAAKAVPIGSRWDRTAVLKAASQVLKLAFYNVNYQDDMRFSNGKRVVEQCKITSWNPLSIAGYRYTITFCIPSSAGQRESRQCHFLALMARSFIC